MAPDPVLDPPGHVVQVPRCNVVGVPTLTDGGGPRRDGATADPVPEEGEKDASECRHGVVSQFEAGPWLGLALVRAHRSRLVQSIAAKHHPRPDRYRRGWCRGRCRQVRTPWSIDFIVSKSSGTVSGTLAMAISSRW